MKKAILIILALLVTGISSAQTWQDNLPKDKLEAGTLTFYEIQKAFHDFWDPKKVDNSGYYFTNGVKVKAYGWKQFKRWEYYWSNRVDKRTGEFPKESAYEAMMNSLGGTPRAPRSASGAWSNLGPSYSTGGYSGLGRINCIATVAGDNNTIYIGSPSGGIWKSPDGGTTWSPLGDYNPVLGVSDIIVQRPVAGQDVLYIATGDRDGGSMWSLNGGQSNDNNSIGVLKSTDGGATWNTTGLTFTTSQKRTTNRLLMLPSDVNTLYAATSVGLYKTTNGGTSWTQLSTTQFMDLEFKPGDPTVMYATNKSGDVYLSTNSGTSWTKTLSTTDYRCEIAVTPADPTLVYAVICNSVSGLAGIYKSTNSGSSFTLLFSGTTTNILNWDCNSTTSGGQGSYDLCIAADPANAGNVFIGGVNSWRSTDGGNTWSIMGKWNSGMSCSASVVHADHHCIVYQEGGTTMFEGNDGGLYKSTDNGVTWNFIGSGIITGQVYRLGSCPTDGNEVIAGHQDNGSKLKSASAWSDVLGGDGFDGFFDYTDKNVMYGSINGGEIRRSLNHGSSWTDITTGLTGSGYWCVPWCIDPAVHTTIYCGYEEVFKSLDQGTSWTAISSFGTSNQLTLLAVAPSNANYIYTSDASTLYMTGDGGTTWSDVTGTLPVGSANITYVSVKADDPETVWVSMGGYTSQRVFQSTNGGTTWTDISSGLPPVPTMCIIQNKLKNPVIELYAGTDVGVYVKNGSDPWTLFSTGLPNVVVAELDIFYSNGITPSKLRAGTFGRGVWESDLLETGVLNPTNLTASASSGTQINLNWAKNSNNNNIILAYNTTTTFGTPVNGTNYASGNSIPGGGTVVYNGNAVNFSHTGLANNTTYYYKIWSYDGSTIYSEGTIANATTLCTLITSLPWTEGFEHAGSLPTCWSQININGSAPWEMKTAGTNSHPASAHSGTYLARCRTLTSGGGYITKFVSPALDLSTTATPVLKFWHTQDFWSPSQDELRIYYKTTQNGSWSLLTSYTTTITSWTEESIVLPNPSATYFIAFEAKVNAGYGVCIDDISVQNGTPVVSTAAVTSITATGASSGGNVTSSGLSSVTARGVCWSTSAGPTIAESHTTDGSGIGSFTSVLTGLLSNTTYYVRAYATNSYGTAYGSDVQFTTLAGNKTVNLTVLLEGLYSGSGAMNTTMDNSGPHWGSGIADKIRLELHDASNFATVHYSSAETALSTSGSASFTVPGTYSANYYLTVRHRNSIAVTSAAPVSFAGSTIFYNFSDLSSKTYGGNVLSTGDGYYVAYTGDVDNDHTIGEGDMTLVNNDAISFMTGYLGTDINGDGIVDAADMTFIDNNSSIFVTEITP